MDVAMVREDTKQRASMGFDAGLQPRVRRVIQRAEPNARRSSPSTLPPPPFASEVNVEGLEWWLDSHVEFASRLLCMGQAIESVGAPADRMALSGATRVLEHVRDALYELYCDAADIRLADLLISGRELDLHVRATYDWCGAIVDGMNAFACRLREANESSEGCFPQAFRHAGTLPVPPMDPLLAAIRGLHLNFASPVEPLRNLERDIEQLHASVEELRPIVGAWANRPSVTSH